MANFFTSIFPCLELVFFLGRAHLLGLGARGLKDQSLQHEDSLMGFDNKNIKI